MTNSKEEKIRENHHHEASASPSHSFSSSTSSSQRRGLRPHPAIPTQQMKVTTTESSSAAVLLNGNSADLQRLSHYWYELHRLSKSAVKERISKFVSEGRYQECVYACKAIFMDKVTQPVNGKEAAVHPMERLTLSQETFITNAALLANSSSSDVDMSQANTRRYTVTRELLSALNNNPNFPEEMAGEIITSIKHYLPLFPDHMIAGIATICVQGLRSDHHVGRAFELLPLALSELHKYSSIELPNISTENLSSPSSPAAFQEWLMLRICAWHWTTAGLLHFPSVLVDMNLTATENKKLLCNIFSRLESLDLEKDVPAIIFLLSSLKKLDKAVLITVVLQLFDRLDSKNGLATVDGSDRERRSKAQSKVLSCEGTTLIYLHLAVTQDPFLGEVLLHLVKTRQVSLTPFCLSLLLNIMRLQRFEQPILDFLHSFICDQLATHSRATESLWLHSVLSDDPAIYVDVENLLIVVINNSLHFDSAAVLPSLVRLGFRLLNTRCSSNRSNRLTKVDQISFEHFSFNVHHQQFSASVNAVHLGAFILRALFQVSPVSQFTILEQLLLNVSMNVNALPSICLFSRLTEEHPEHFLRYRHQITETIDQLANLPMTISLPFIYAILPLLHVSSRMNPADQNSIRDYLVMALRKALFLPTSDARLFACMGLIALIEQVLIGRIGMVGEGAISLSQGSQGGASSIDTVLLMDVMTLIRRSLSSERAVRETLYHELCRLSARHEIVRVYILDLLLPHFLHYYNDNAAARIPFHISQCTQNKQVSEPLAMLIMTVARCLDHSSLRGDMDTEEDGSVVTRGRSEAEIAGSRAYIKLKHSMTDIVQRMVDCTSRDLGYDPNSNVSSVSDLACQQLHHGLYQSLMEYVLLTSPKSTERRGDDIGDEGWNKFTHLFQQFYRLDQWINGNKVTNQAESAAGKTKGKKKKAVKKDDSDSDSDDDPASRVSQSSRSGVVSKANRSASVIVSSKKQKASIEYILSPLAENIVFRRFVHGHQYQQYPLQLLMRDVDLQRWVIQCSLASLQRLSDNSAVSSVNGSVYSIGQLLENRSDVEKIFRCLFFFADKMYQVIVKAAETKAATSAADEEVEEKKDEPKQKGRSVLSLCLHALSVAVIWISGRGSLVLHQAILAGVHKRYTSTITTDCSTNPDCEYVAVWQLAAQIRIWTQRYLDYERIKDATAAFALLTVLADITIVDRSSYGATHRAECLEWAIERFQAWTDSPHLVKAVLHYIMSVSQGSDDTEKKLILSMVKDLGNVCGTRNAAKSERKSLPTYRMIGLKTSHLLATQICQQLKLWLEEAEFVLKQIKLIGKTQQLDADIAEACRPKDYEANEASQANNNNNQLPADPENRIKAIHATRVAYENSCCARVVAVCEVLAALTHVNFDSNVEAIIRSFTHTFKLLTQITKTFCSLANPLPANYYPLCEYALSRLSNTALDYCFSLSLTSQEQGKEETKSQVAREKHQIPELTYCVSTFEAAVVQLNAQTKTRMDLTSFIKHSRSRDFKIDLDKWQRCRKRQKKQSQKEDEESANSSDEEEQKHRSHRLHRSMKHESSQSQQHSSRKHHRHHSSQKLKTSQASQSQSQHRRRRSADKSSSSSSESAADSPYEESDKENRNRRNLYSISSQKSQKIHKDSQKRKASTNQPSRKESGSSKKRLKTEDVDVDEAEEDECSFIDGEAADEDVHEDGDEERDDEEM